MAYTTIEDLSKVLPASRVRELSDDTGAGEIDGEIVQWAIDTAAEVIDSYIGQIAALPLSGTPAAPLAVINQNLAVCNLFARTTLELPEVWKDRCAASIALLEKIADGSVSLFPAPEAPEEPRTGIQSRSRAKEFGEKRMRGYS